jgi:hypothetical protein
MLGIGRYLEVKRGMRFFSMIRLSHQSGRRLSLLPTLIVVMYNGATLESFLTIQNKITKQLMYYDASFPTFSEERVSFICWNMQNVQNQEMKLI